MEFVYRESTQLLDSRHKQNKSESWSKGNLEELDNKSEIGTGIETTDKFGIRQGLLLVALSLVTFCAAAIFSLQAPFFPAEAEKKNLSATEFGITFGIFGLAQFLLSPFLGSLLQNVDGRIALLWGSIIAGLSTIIFGLLDQIVGQIPFMLISYSLRVIEAIGSTTLFVAVFGLVGSNVPRYLATSYAVLDTTYGCGLAIGPSIGATFFNIGGFTLPFVVVGIMNIVMGGIAFVSTLSLLNLEVPTRANEKKELFGFFKLFQIPTVLLYTSCLICCSITSNFISSILEPHLRQFNLDVTQLGLVFLIQGIIQASVGPIFGLICDRIPNYIEYVTLLGIILNTLASLLIGPSPLLPISPNLALTLVSLVILGFGSSAIIVSTFPLNVREVKNNGFPDVLAIIKLTSGLIMSGFSAGIFLGPLLAGLFYDNLGFQNATLCITILNLAFGVVVYFVIWTGKSGAKGLRRPD